MSQTPAPDSAALPLVRVDSLRLIPCGPTVGTFTSDARILVSDTVGGWAQLRVEGWVPIEVALPYMKKLDAPLLGQADSTATQERSRCAAITLDGKRCSRKAQAGSKYCWQHQPQ